MKSDTQSWLGRSALNCRLTLSDNSPQAQACQSVSTLTLKKHEVPDELLSDQLANYKKCEDLIGENGLLKQLTKLVGREGAGC